MRFTVFTPTYNRAYIIKNLYNSLKAQTFKDFEWVIVDDGSTDDTELLIESFINENKVNINYIKTANGGKHRAINIGVKEAQGELFFIVDSDDYLISNALSKVHEVEMSILESEKSDFCGICGLKGYTSNQMIGSSFDGEFLDITALQRDKYKIVGDKAEIFYTKVIKSYPFPEFVGEKFLTECVVWDKMAFDGFKLRFFNEIIYICDYLEDGLTKNIKATFYNSPKGYGLYIYQSTLFGKVSGVFKWEKYWNYYKTFKNKLSFVEIAKNLHQNPLSLCLRFLGIKLFYKLYDK